MSLNGSKLISNFFRDDFADPIQLLEGLLILLGKRHDAIWHEQLFYQRRDTFSKSLLKRAQITPTRNSPDLDQFWTDL